MNKKHLIGVIVVLIISGGVIYFQLKNTPINALLHAAKNLNFLFLALVFGVMFLSYFFEAGILATLSKGDKKNYSFWAFLRIPLIQALFNAITPLSTGGQPSQLFAMVQMGMKGARATSILLMKFIIYQICVLFAYVSTIVFGFRMIVGKFSGLAFFILVGFIIHISSIIFLLAIMFAYNWTKKVTLWVMKILEKFFSLKRVDNWRQSTLKQIETFYREGQNLKREKKKLIIAIILTLGQLLCFYSIPYFILLALNVKTSWLAVTAMNIMIIMFMAIVPIPGASGGAEFSFQTLFSTFIHSNTLLVLGMFIWRFTTYFLGLLLGLIGWVIRPKKVEES